MRYNVTFNQLELMAYNEQQPKGKKIDIKDAIILQQLWHLSQWKEIEKIKLNTGEYFWAAYGKIINELPALGFTTNDSLSKRIREKLLKNKLLKLHVNWQDNSKTYWQITEPGLKIAAPGQPDGTPRTNGRDTPGRMDGTPPVEWTDNYNTIDYLTNDEREALSHFEFLKKSFKEDFIKWEVTYKGKIFDMVKFINAFNNDMPLEQTKKNHLLINRLEKYSRSWISRQSEKEKPNKDPSHIKISLEKPKNFM